MKYTGRIAMSSFVIGNIILGYFIFDAYSLLFSIVQVALFITFGWWIGLQYDKVKFFSERDELTGMYNRRFVHKRFSELCSLADRNDKKIACFILDVNNFKTINDLYGHNAGDVVLQNISNLLAGTTRKSDVVARWGGDEFIIIVPFIEKPNIDSIITRLHMTLYELSHNYNTITTVSIGSALYPEDASTLNELIKNADRNMYKEKFNTIGVARVWETTAR